jgi:hypothetical protein
MQVTLSCCHLTCTPEAVIDAMWGNGVGLGAGEDEGACEGKGKDEELVGGFVSVELAP